MAGSGRVSMVALLLALAASTAQGRCLELEGALEQGGFIWGRVAPGSEVTLAGQRLDVLADGTTFAGFGRDAPATAELVVTGAQDCREILQVARREYQVQRVEGVPQATVTPPPEQLARIRREAALVASARAPRLARPDLLATVLAGFVWPAQGPISGVYGSQRFYNGEPRRPHYQLSSTFLHMSRVSVQVGDELQAGDIIGAVGATGRASGPHLDWRMNWREERIDPQLLAPPMPKP
jgi:hypothetical protein